MKLEANKFSWAGLFGATLCCLAASGCSSDAQKSDPDDIPIELYEDVVTTSQAFSNSATVSDDKLVIPTTGNEGDLAKLAPGKVIVGLAALDYWEGRNPEGFMRRIVEVKADGTNTEIRTGEATLFDVIKRGRLKMDDLRMFPTREEREAMKGGVATQAVYEHQASWDRTMLGPKSSFGGGDIFATNPTPATQDERAKPWYQRWTFGTGPTVEVGADVKITSGSRGNFYRRFEKNGYMDFEPEKIKKASVRLDMFVAIDDWVQVEATGVAKLTRGLKTEFLPYVGAIGVIPFTLKVNLGAAVEASFQAKVKLTGSLKTHTKVSAGFYVDEYGVPRTMGEEDKFEPNLGFTRSAEGSYEIKFFVPIAIEGIIGVKWGGLGVFASSGPMLSFRETVIPGYPCATVDSELGSLGFTVGINPSVPEKIRKWLLKSKEFSWGIDLCDIATAPKPGEEDKRLFVCRKSKLPFQDAAAKVEYLGERGYYPVRTCPAAPAQDTCKVGVGLNNCLKDTDCTLGANGVPKLELTCGWALQGQPCARCEIAPGAPCGVCQSGTGTVPH